ncbi:uncharacterized protein LOC117250933 isoform X1 [Epinephelus lanceolatus]
MTCFSSSDPAAMNATLLFDLDNDDENLWTRSSHGGPLPLCSSPSSPPDSLCWVCLEQKVYAVCHNLTDGVKIMMEAGGVSVDLLKSDCPKPPSDGDDGASKSWLLAIIIPILLLLLLLLLIGVLLYIFRKKLLKSLRAKQGSCSQRPETEESEQSVALTNRTPSRGSADVMFST